jgi:hypothetical protein
MQYLKALYNFFPVQLLLLHFRRNQFFLILWVLLFATIFQSFGKEYGIPYLLLDPEYLGTVDFFSFSIVGVCFGGFLITWNISTYTLNSHYFQFLAATRRPFAVYTINNSIIPAAFIITYFILTYKFQIKNDKIDDKDVFIELAGFLSGFVIMTTLAAGYFQATNSNIFNVLKLNTGNIGKIGKRVVKKQNKLLSEYKYKHSDFPVDYLISATFTIRNIRSVEHYDDSMIQSVFKQNHYNAFIIQMVFLLIIIGLGFTIDNQFFRIPSGASLLLLFAIFISFSGFLNFWLGTWKAPVLFAAILIINVLVQQQIVTHNNKAYGIKYSGEKAEYSYDSFYAICNDSTIARDKQNTISILNAWKRQTGEKKPKIVFLNFTGGGMSAAMFSSLVLQKTDSLTDGKLMKNAFLMTGASGGMLGAAYYREVYLRKKMNQIYSHHSPKYINNVAKDLLNPVAFTILVNDLGMPFRKFSLNGETYTKDRGYVFERVFNENTEFFLDKSVKEYKQMEEVAVIPMMIIVPTIINDQRKLYITPQPVSYLMKPLHHKFSKDSSVIDGVDFGAMFSKQNAGNLKMTTALRMNATYPYILPYVSLPSEPEIKVMDAGFRDNYGIETTAKFIHTFQDWIKENTSGVIVVQVRSNKRSREIEKYERETIISRMLKPVSNIYANFLVRQEYDQNYLIAHASEWVNGKLEFINFEYVAEKKEEEASLSLHLTDKEKQDIRKTIGRYHTQVSLIKLMKALE